MVGRDKWVLSLTISVRKGLNRRHQTVLRKMILRIGGRMGFWARDKADQEDWQPKYSYGGETFENLFAKKSRLRLTCQSCGSEFESNAELAIHNHLGHVRENPSIVFGGRSLLSEVRMVSEASEADDWIFENSQKILVNGIQHSAQRAQNFLSSQRVGSFVLEAINGKRNRRVVIEFSIPTESELQLVDSALSDLLKYGQPTQRSIVEFTKVRKSAPGAALYIDGLENYLFGLLESVPNPRPKLPNTRLSRSSRFDYAVQKLSKFDRPAAEIICGLIALKYNQFGRAIQCTRSPLVSAVSLRIKELLEGGNPDLSANLSLGSGNHPELSLCDEQSILLLRSCSAPADKITPNEIRRTISGLTSHYDRVKVMLYAAECLRLNGRESEARTFASSLRDEIGFETWFKNFQENGGWV